MLIPAFAVLVPLLAQTASATWLHVNKGCVEIDSKPVCAGKAGGKVEVGALAVIKAKFSGDVKVRYEKPGCAVLAKWPRDWGDVYFGADNCIYDSKGQNFGQQCCSTINSDHPRLRNPYNYWYG